VKVRKKPVVVEAFQFDPRIRPWPAGVQPFEDKDSRVMSEMMDALPIGADPTNYGYIETSLEGGQIVSPGDWVITNAAGASHVCKPAIFEATYERVPDEEPSELERKRVGS
jgi:hypothetical protein